MRKLMDLQGRKFGRLAVLVSTRNRSGDVVWSCRCDCGSTVLAYGSMLTHGRTVSCGCARRERAAQFKLKHGLHRTGQTHPLYETWKGMIARCSNPNHIGFARYGGRGVRVCERWRNDFTAFLADMGPKPSTEHSLDRINGDGDYEPGNCRWATYAEQARNSRPRKRRPPRYCSVDGCGQSYLALGLCGRHYRAAKRAS